jgi:hypothetical protein
MKFRLNQKREIVSEPEPEQLCAVTIDENAAVFVLNQALTGLYENWPLSEHIFPPIVESCRQAHNCDEN